MPKMKYNLEAQVAKFLYSYCDFSKPVLLGLSGGPDSIALFHLLLAFKKQFSLMLHVAHLDHGWREESSKEANTLKDLVGSHRIPWHSMQIKTNEVKGNLEEWGRQERLRFFTKICKEYQCQAVILGHHTDDQAETVLKRIFEGASLCHLQGLKEITSIDTLTLWRPLLGIPKKDIMLWLQQRGISFFTDITNLQSKFLRGRMRTSLMPLLAEIFGKEIAKNLCLLGERAGELEKYLNAKIAPFLIKIIYGTMGIYIDLSEETLFEIFEIKYLIRKVCEQEGIVPSHDGIEMLSRLLTANAANKKILVGKRAIYVDRKRLFIPKEVNIFLPNEKVPLKGGSFVHGDWKIVINKASSASDLKMPCWRDAWKGECFAHFIVEGEIHNYSIGLGIPQAAYKGTTTTLDKWWTAHKVPAFLRAAVPVIYHPNGEPIFEFLSGRFKKTNSSSHPSENYYIIELSHVIKDQT